MNRATFDKLTAMGIEFEDYFIRLLVKPLDDFKVHNTVVNNDAILIGYWSWDAQGKKHITHANLDDKIYFYIKASRVMEGEKIVLTLC